MKLQPNKPKPNYCWKYVEVVTLLRILKNFQILWIPNITKKSENRETYKLIKNARNRVITLIKRPWSEISFLLARMRFEFKSGKNLKYYDMVKRSLTVDGNKVRKSFSENRKKR